MESAILNHSKSVINDLDYLLNQLQNKPKQQPPYIDSKFNSKDRPTPNHHFDEDEGEIDRLQTSDKIMGMLSEIDSESVANNKISYGDTQRGGQVLRCNINNNQDIQYNSIKRVPSPSNNSYGNDRPRHTYDLLRNGTRKSPEDIKSRNAFLSLSPTQLSKESRANVENLLAELNSALKSPRKLNRNYDAINNGDPIESIEAVMRVDSFSSSSNKASSHPINAKTNLASLNSSMQYMNHNSPNVACDEEIYSSIAESNALSSTNYKSSNLTYQQPQPDNLDFILGKLEKDLKIREAERVETNRRIRMSSNRAGMPVDFDGLSRTIHPGDGMVKLSTGKEKDVLIDSHIDPNIYESFINVTGCSPLICFHCDEIIVDHSIHALGRDWHPQHFTCAVCQTEIGTGNFFEYQGLPFCENDYHEKFSPKCAACKEPILDKCVTALDQTWHPEHFKCSGTCGRIFDPGEPYHVISQSDLTNRHQSKTARNDAKSISQISLNTTSMQGRSENRYSNGSRLTATSGDSCKVRQLPEIVHESSSINSHAMACGKEGITDPESPIKSIDGEMQYAFCREDYFVLFAPKCRACMNPILENFISALDSKWHPDCFVCHDCHMPFGKGSFYEYRLPKRNEEFENDSLAQENMVLANTNRWSNDSNGTRDKRLSNNQDIFNNCNYESWPLCQTHYEARKTGSSICFGCGLEIVPGCKSVTALYKKFHPEHFVCAFCLKQLSSTFKERKGKPYCHSCFDKLM